MFDSCLYVFVQCTCPRHVFRWTFSHIGMGRWETGLCFLIKIIHLVNNIMFFFMVWSNVSACSLLEMRWEVVELTAHNWMKINRKHQQLSRKASRKCHVLCGTTILNGTSLRRWKRSHMFPTCLTTTLVTSTRNYPSSLQSVPISKEHNSPW